MKIMTFNLRCDFFLDFNNRWENRKDIVFEIINKGNLDIIGLQELTPKMHKDFIENINNFNIVGSPRSKKWFVENNDILVSKRHKIISSKTFWLSKTPNNEGSRVWYSMFPRICTTATIALDTGEKVKVYNTHLDVLLPKAREFALKKLLEEIEKEHIKDGIKVILTGDFNATPNSKLIKEFKNKTFNSKSFIAVQDKNKDLYNKSTLSSFKGKEKGLHIDYIFVSDEITINNVEIIKHNKNGKYPSDHYPLMAELSL